MDEIFRIGEIAVPIMHGSRPWLAEITGPDPQYGLRREFVRKTMGEGEMIFTVARAGIYQFQDFPAPDYPGSSQFVLVSGFVRVGADGRNALLGRKEVLALVRMAHP